MIGANRWLRKTNHVIATHPPRRPLLSLAGSYPGQIDFDTGGVRVPVPRQGAVHLERPPRRAVGQRLE